MATIHEALTLGTDELAVDGVLLVAELGDYEVNDKEQKLYPRFELFLQITDTFQRCHRAVPIFNDKHLSYRWTHAKRMYDISKELDFPFMAGSSLPGELPLSRHRVAPWIKSSVWPRRRPRPDRFLRFPHARGGAMSARASCGR